MLLTVPLLEMHVSELRAADLRRESNETTHDPTCSNMPAGNRAVSLRSLRRAASGFLRVPPVGAGHSAQAHRDNGGDPRASSMEDFLRRSSPSNAGCKHACAETVAKALLSLVSA